MIEPTYSARDVAEIIDRSYAWVNTHARDNDIGHMKGNRRAFTTADLIALQRLVDPKEKRGRSRR